jgi:hypothetical protein
VRPTGISLARARRSSNETAPAIENRPRVPNTAKGGLRWKATISCDAILFIEIGRDAATGLAPSRSLNRGPGNVVAPLT